jgi:hypothetical protein
VEDGAGADEPDAGQDLRGDAAGIAVPVGQAVGQRG